VLNLADFSAHPSQKALFMEEMVAHGRLHDLHPWLFVVGLSELIDADATSLLVLDLFLIVLEVDHNERCFDVLVDSLQHVFALLPQALVATEGLIVILLVHLHLVVDALRLVQPILHGAVGYEHG